MKNARVMIPIICFMFAIAAVFAGCQKKTDNAKSGDPNPKGGDAPNVKLTKVDQDGLKKNLEGLKGKVVLIDFWQYG